MARLTPVSMLRLSVNDEFVGGNEGMALMLRLVAGAALLLTSVFSWRFNRYRVATPPPMSRIRNKIARMILVLFIDGNRW